MSKFVIVSVFNPGHDGRSRANRRFANGQKYRLEVLDQEQDPPKVKQMVDRDGKQVEVEVPNPAVIGQASWRAIQADELFSKSDDLGTQIEVSAAALEEAKRQAAESASEVSALRIRVVELEDALRIARAEAESAKREVDLAKGKAAEAESLLAAATAPAPESKQAAKADDKGKSKGGK